MSVSVRCYSIGYSNMVTISNLGNDFVHFEERWISFIRTYATLTMRMHLINHNLNSICKFVFELIIVVVQNLRNMNQTPWGPCKIYSIFLYSSKHGYHFVDLQSSDQNVHRTRFEHLPMTIAMELCQEQVHQGSEFSHPQSQNSTFTRTNRIIRLMEIL